jgi:hypothetical protein
MNKSSAVLLRVVALAPLLAAVVFVNACAEDVLRQAPLPPDRFCDGWTKSEEAQKFVKDDLYGHIDGGAELFHEFGFDDLTVQRYMKDDSELSLELYRMTDPEAALGIYLAKKGKETALPGIVARNSGGRFQLSAIKAEWFIQVNNFDGDSANVPVMTELAIAFLKSVPDKRPHTPINLLPEKGLVKGSELLVRGEYSMQPVYTFGKGDVLQLRGKVLGAVGQYRAPDKSGFTMMIIPYPDTNSALAAFKNLLAGLDQYLEVQEKWDRGFIFKDYRNMYGIVQLDGATLESKVNLIAKPSRSD